MPCLGEGGSGQRLHSFIRAMLVGAQRKIGLGTSFQNPADAEVGEDASHQVSLPRAARSGLSE